MCLCVCVGGGGVLVGEGPSSLLQTVTLLQGLSTSLAWGRECRLLSGSSHLKEALGQEAGLWFKNMEELWDTGRSVVWSQHTEGPIVATGMSLAGPGSSQLGFIFQGPSSGLLWAQAPEHSGKEDCRLTWPSLPSVLCSAPSLRSWCGRPEHGLLGGQVCGAEGVGGRVGRMALMEGGLQLFSKRDRRSSLLLLGRSGGSR